jgi:UDP-glucose 4-epimerase
VLEEGQFFMKILVTGGAGYIGGTVAGLLVQTGHKALIFDNLSHGRRDLLPAGVEFVEGELADRQALKTFSSQQKKRPAFRRRVALCGAH